MAPRRSVGITVVGLRDFQADLRAFARNLDDLKIVNDRIASLVRDRARAAAPGGVKSAIRKRVRPDQASIEIYHNPQRALGVFMGAKRRFGWYANARYRGSSARQFERWVGNQWEPGDSAGKPYYIGDAINQAVPEIVEMYGEEVERLAGRAFPEGGGGTLARIVI